MEKVVKNTHKFKHKHTGEVTEFLTSTRDGVERPLCFNDQIKPGLLKMMESMGEVVDRPDDLETNDWPA